MGQGECCSWQPRDSSTSSCLNQTYWDQSVRCPLQRQKAVIENLSYSLRRLRVQTGDSPSGSFMLCHEERICDRLDRLESEQPARTVGCNLGGIWLSTTAALEFRFLPCIHQLLIGNPCWLACVDITKDSAKQEAFGRTSAGWLSN